MHGWQSEQCLGFWRSLFGSCRPVSQMLCEPHFYLFRASKMGYSCRFRSFCFVFSYQGTLRNQPQRYLTVLLSVAGGLILLLFIWSVYSVHMLYNLIKSLFRVLSHPQDTTLIAYCMIGTFYSTSHLKLPQKGGWAGGSWHVEHQSMPLESGVESLLCFLGLQLTCFYQCMHANACPFSFTYVLSQIHLA